MEDKLIEKGLSHIKIIEKNNDKVICFCEKHNEKFIKTFSALLRSSGCKYCRNDSFKNNRTKTNDQFIDECIKKHNNFYDYSKVIYKGAYENIEILCPFHGSFFQQASVHLLGSGCQKCKAEKLSHINSIDNIEWVKRFNITHQGKYDYSLIKEKICSKEKIEIKCPKHGSFFQLPQIHNFGHGCPKCAIDNNQQTKLKDQDKVINDFNIVHKNKFDYSKVKYEGTLNKVEIICPLHGSFFQRPNDHLTGYGCPSCGTLESQDEIKIYDFIKEYFKDARKNDRNIIPPKELDIFVEELKLGIEYNGNFWHSHNKLETKEQIFYHQQKSLRCLEKGIHLIHIFEFEWLNPIKKEIWKSILNYKLGIIKKKVFARKCVVKYISDIEFNNFCLENHIQGKRNTSIKIGLYNNDMLCAVMGFVKDPKHEWELTRFCQLKNNSIVGGASKLFSFFVKEHKPNKVLSFCDFRFSKGDLYRNLGFKQESLTKPNYFYIKGETICLTRYKSQKNKLKKLLENYDENLSEFQNMINNGYRRIWDSGNLKFIWTP